MVLTPKVLIDRYLFNIKVGLFDTLNIFKSLNTNSLTASGKGHRRRKIRPPAAKDRALRGALVEGPPRARLLPEPCLVSRNLQIRLLRRSVSGKCLIIRLIWKMRSLFSYAFSVKC